MSTHRQTIKTTEATRRTARAARRQLRCNHTNPSTDEEKRWIYVLPASVLVVAWMLSVSVDVACVRALVRPLYGGPDDWGCRDTDDPNQRGSGCSPAPARSSKDPILNHGLRLPPPAPAADLQRTSCPEQLLRIYNGRSLLLPVSRVLRWTPSTPLLLSGHVKERQVEVWALKSEKLFD